MSQLMEQTAKKSVDLQQNATDLQLWSSLEGLEPSSFFAGERESCGNYSDQFFFAFLIAFSDFFKSEMMQDKMGGHNSSFQLH